MKYSVKVDIFNQKDVNAGQAKPGLTLPVQLESVRAYSIATDVNTSGSTTYTAVQLTAQLRSKFNITNVVSESLSSNGVQVSGSLQDRKYNYTVVLPIEGLV